MDAVNRKLPGAVVRAWAKDTREVASRVILKDPPKNKYGMTSGYECVRARVCLSLCVCV